MPTMAETYKKIDRMEYEDLDKTVLSLRARMEVMLMKRGCTPEVVRGVMNRVIFAPENEAFASRWEDSEAGYPVAISTLAWMTTSTHAGEWIAKHKPMAWFRPMFDDKMMEDIKAKMRLAGKLCSATDKEDGKCDQAAVSPEIGYCTKHAPV